MNLSERIAKYAYRYWMRAGMTEWPSVRRTARALRIRQTDIEEAEGGGGLLHRSIQLRAS